MKVLCTFSGKYGDILWSLPTARQIAKDIAGGQVDFAVMPYYESLLPLLEAQEYISKAYVIPNWIRTHSNHGDQPWEAPQADLTARPFAGKTFDPPLGEFIFEAKHTEECRQFWAYDKVYHLTYKGHPGINAPNMPLVDFVAYQQGITLEQPVIPFLKAEKDESEKKCLVVALAFNEQYKESKEAFYWALVEKFGGDLSTTFLDVTKMPWDKAASVIDAADLFIGCRSANWVIAMGLGKHTVTFEPHPSRHASCHLGTVFGCKYGQEIAIPYMMPPHAASETAAGIIRKKLEEVKSCAVESQT